MHVSPRLRLVGDKVAKSSSMVCWERDPGSVRHVHAVTGCLCLGCAMQTFLCGRQRRTCQTWAGERSPSFSFQAPSHL